MTGEIRIEETEAGNVETNPDGAFKVIAESSAEHLNSTYKIVVTKMGYLDYTITGISLEEVAEIDIGEYKLIAGDVIKTGEINLDDLVSLNDKYGKLITSIDGEIDVDTKYDLNEDGVINRLDRDILAKNYGKKVEVHQWEQRK